MITAWWLSRSFAASDSILKIDFNLCRVSRVHEGFLLLPPSSPPNLPERICGWIGIFGIFVLCMKCVSLATLWWNTVLFKVDSYLVTSAPMIRARRNFNKSMLRMYFSVQCQYLFTWWKQRARRSEATLKSDFNHQHAEACWEKEHTVIYQMQNLKLRLNRH